MFESPEKARAYLKKIRWPNGIICPHCHAHDRIYIIAPHAETKTRDGLYDCGRCYKQFTVTVGTIFEGSKIPLHQWLLAWYFVYQGMRFSIREFQRRFGIGSYRTAWFMMRRIRETLRDPVFNGSSLQKYVKEK